MTIPHKHAALIKQWADDQSLQIWAWSRSGGIWLKGHIRDIIQSEYYDFTLGDKPTAPPQRVCTLGGLEFPAPETKAPTEGAEVWFIGASEACNDTWRNYSYQLRYLLLGLAHLTSEAAEAHSRALQAANLQAIGEAK